MNTLKIQPCGKPCGVSTSILDELTFGYGELDPNGFWEFECLFCELAHYKRAAMAAAKREKHLRNWAKTVLDLFSSPNPPDPVPQTLVSAVKVVLQYLDE